MTQGRNLKTILVNFVYAGQKIYSKQFMNRLEIK